MFKHLLFVASLAVGLSATAQKSATPLVLNRADVEIANSKAARSIISEHKFGTTSNNMMKAAASDRVVWYRPAGQFYGTGFDPTAGAMYFTPLMVRPWTVYTFENASSASGTPSWEIEKWYNGDYSTFTADTRDLEGVSYTRWEQPNQPVLSYKNIGSFPAGSFQGGKETPYNTNVMYPNNECMVTFSDGGSATFLQTPQYYSYFSRRQNINFGLSAYYGLTPYEGEEKGWFFGTNNSGLNAAAVRFEKPASPYLLNSVYFYYWVGSDDLNEPIPVTKEITLKAYVFKTENPQVDETRTDSDGKDYVVSYAELGELIAECEAVLPKSKAGEDSGFVKFDFIERNPVTGAENTYSIPVEDDIIVVVTGFNQQLGKEEVIFSPFTTDTYPTGHGTHGYFGRFEMSDDGDLQYMLFTTEYAIGDYSIPGIMADISYPWIIPFFDETEVKFGNDGDTQINNQTGEITKMGLQYPLYLSTTATTEDMEVTFDGEEECEWLEITEVLDFVDDDEEFADQSCLTFEAAPNPTDEDRVCHVNITIPAASYEIIFTQGTNASGVNVIVNNSKTSYYDLAGRRVVNPEKGIYIKKEGNKTSKVIL